MAKKKKKTTPIGPENEELDLELEDQEADLEEEEPDLAPAPEEPESVKEPPVPVVSAHNHFCDVCLQPVAHCAGSCQHEGPQYCSAHVPQEHHDDVDHPYFGTRVTDKPVIRMTVKVDDN